MGINTASENLTEEELKERIKAAREVKRESVIFNLSASEVVDRLDEIFGEVPGANAEKRRNEARRRKSKGSKANKK